MVFEGTPVYTITFSFLSKVGSIVFIELQTSRFALLKCGKQNMYSINFSTSVHVSMSVL